MFFALFSLSSSVSNAPIYPAPTCDTGYFNPYSYTCSSSLWYSDSDLELDETTENLNCINGNPVVYDGSSIRCDIDTPDADYTYFSNDSFYYLSDAVLQGIDEERLKASYVACKSSGYKSPKYCEYIANFYAATSYTDTVAYAELNSRASGTTNGYSYWPQNIPWVVYTTTLNTVKEEDLITTKFSYDDVITFVLARYARDGRFLGYKELQRDFTFCGGNQNITEIWRVFGSNYKNKCEIDFDQYLGKDTYFYEPFFLEDSVLRPIPVVVKGSTSKRPFRRFFVYNDFTATKKIVLTNLSISFELRDDTEKTIEAPVFEVTYTTTKSTTGSYSFNVFYMQSFSRFWKSVIIVAAVFGSLALAYFIFKVYTFAQHYGDDGMDSTVIIGILGEFLHIVGVVLFFIVCVFSFYILIFFKWQKDIYMFLPPESELTPFIVMQWVAFACVTISTIIKVVQTTTNDVFIIDWEERRDKDVPVSSWRRLMLTNEWVRVYSTRSYNIPFTLIVVLFILTGFKTDLMATPIPSTSLYDTGETYKVLRFAYTSFIWLIFMLAEWIFTTFIMWMTFGNPFANFLDLAATSNCSVLIMCSKSYGYYLHGRSIHVNADESMEKLHANLATETDGKIGLRGLVPNTDNQVFEVYLQKVFRDKFKETYESVQSSVKPRMLANEKVFTSASVSQEALASFDRLNTFLKNFINDQNAYDVSPAPFSQKFLGIAPQVNEKSMFLIEDDISFKQSMFAGIEWTVMLFLLLLFVGIETETSSPPIAAFVTFFADAILKSIFVKAGRSNIAKKSLIDNRFIMS